MKWNRHKIADNKGKPLDIWVCGKYQICPDVRAPSTRKGWSDQWLFAVYFDKRFVSAGSDLAQAKELAEIHATIGDDV